MSFEHTDWNCVFSWENPNIGKIQICTKKVCQIKAQVYCLRDLNPKSMNPVIFMLQNSSNMTEINKFANIGEFHLSSNQIIKVELELYRVEWPALHTAYKGSFK